MLALDAVRRPVWFGEDDPDGLRVAYLSTYSPRECGLATFCEDLLKATTQSDGAGEPMVIAMENGVKRYHYSWPVVTTVDERKVSEYEAAAHFLNNSAIDIVSLQHEFGIFSGQETAGIYRFLDHLDKPLVTTLHTVSPQPDPWARSMIRKLERCSEQLVVFNDFATDILEEEYGVERDKVTLIHHGAPAPFPAGREAAKELLGLSGKRVLSTFGLISRGKGIEYALSALPAIKERHPDVCYLVIGETHPSVQREEKESYREELIRFVRENGLEGTVHFVNRYLTKPEIISYLAATDVYLTPYLGAHQIVSGTLAYAVAAGRAIVSTPYLYARFLLHEERGLLVDFRSSQAIADVVKSVLGDPGLQHKLESRTLAYGRQMLWPAVGDRYCDLFREVTGQEVIARPAYQPLQPGLAPHAASGVTR
ncbi:MAG: glycosyltransferase [Armatimonadetes bacterium]|nr:glycosyltransferase [Armatimonadota bacterium]NIM23495.1 glycosyltransferase [Armatimonadota bacterium]NIM67361.1 glycosyltransferase [Armatimonadota bacterium]NIM75862.1 glycosyltransferase [Armatimonadota bacterium]NIN05547.1 glycosyltransferase [Armatimonadota bacterium]